MLQTTPQGHDALERFRTVRGRSLDFARAFTAEDWMLQSMPDASPLKWHLAHTTWFFEIMILKPHAPGYAVFDDTFNHLFNSYYLSLGDMHARPRRGLLSRPSAEEILAYRAHVDAAMAAFLPDAPDALVDLMRVGLQHEEQHQELMATDIKHALSHHPFAPAPAARARAAEPAGALDWLAFEGGETRIGAQDGCGFDNERPRHAVSLTPYALATRTVTNGEWLAFMADGGYAMPEFWLSDGWDWVRANRREAPLYWRRDDRGWRRYTLAGAAPVDEDAPVCHVTFYEAAAYAHWAGYRLPTEAEWEHAAVLKAGPDGRFADVARACEPGGAPAGEGLRAMFGDVWEWTGSAYRPYPGFRAAEGAVGEYNGKFMVNQMVLRGGSCATPPGHVRATYRNFFPAHADWQYSGVRLARDL